MAHRLIIEGFNTKAEAQAFADWYEGAGEQDAANWFEARKEEGVIDVDWMGNVGTVQEDGNDLIMTVKPQ